MNPNYLFRARSGRFISLLVCSALLVSMLVATPRGSAKSPRKTKTTAQPLIPQGDSQRQRQPAPRDAGRRVDPIPPQTGPPAANLPNLDELRRRKPEKPEAPAPVPSTMRKTKRQFVSNSLQSSSRDRNDGSARSASVPGSREKATARSHHARVTRSLLKASLATEPLPQNGRINFALTANGGVASASSVYPPGTGYNATPAMAINGERTGLVNGAPSWWNDGTPSSWSDWLEVDFDGSKSIDEIDLFTTQDSYLNPAPPTETMTFTLYGLTAFDVQCWNGSGWVTVPGGQVTGNNKVWKKINFAPITTTRIRVSTNASPDGYSRITELEAWGDIVQPHLNFALAANGGVASASSVYPPGTGYNATPAMAINGERTGLVNGAPSWWNDGTPSSWSDWLEVDFDGSKSIDEIDLFTTQDASTNPAPPTETMTFSLYGLTAFDVQYWNGSGWVTMPGAQVTGNNKVWKKINFAAITTTKIRVSTNASLDGYSRITELEAWGLSAGDATRASSLSQALLDPFNQPGNQLQARDCEWSLPLVSLPGRAGLDLGLTLSYSSMVWTPTGNAMYFDADNGNPSPGFRLGFPTLGNLFLDTQANVNARMMVTSSGRHVEFRYAGHNSDFGFDLYKAGDSSYAELLDYGTTIWLRTTDGTNMRFVALGGEWHCDIIRDRNGNKVSAGYNGYGDITSVTDTLGRVLYFNYDTYGNLNSISQNWNGWWRDLVTFGWSTKTLHPNFSGPVFGAADDQTIPVLDWVGLMDGSHYNFEYTDRGQVNVIRHYAAAGGSGTGDDFQLSYLAYNYEYSGDCPRISAARVWASNWTGINGIPAEVVTSFADNHDGTHQMTTPDSTVYKEFYGSGWQHGLVTSSQVKTGSTVQKTTTTTYDQDNTNVGYYTNPRVIQTLVFDGTNTRKTTVDYSNETYRQYGLPYYVSEYAANGTEMRRTYTDYNLSSEYVNLHIIGLVSAVHLVDVTNGWHPQAKTSYTYDSTTIDPQATWAVQHDAAYDQNYNSSLHKRGNVTSVSRWDINNIDTTYTTTTMSYDAAGSLLSTTDPSGHTSSVSYLDKFSTDGVNLDAARSFSTFAYPTMVTDADGFSSSIWYNYDFGAKTNMQGPPPQNQSQGIIQRFSYDEAMRLKQVTTTNTGAYVHYEYGPDYTSTFASVNSVAANYWESDSYTNQFFDGRGRVFAVSSNHPGSTGGNKAQFTRYDQMGRAVQQTNPFEIDSGWNSVGDDSAGYQFNVANTFDWKGRPLRTYNMDGTFKEASYAGCGCAGGEVVTIEDEVGRQQKVYSDGLGRQIKAEILNTDSSVYSTTTNTFNTRDQVTLVRQYAGTDQSSTYQDTTMSYDGYGRLQSKHAPEQNSGTATTFVYNTDDTLYSVTDARGASTTYSYNGRHLVTNITYSAPSPIFVPTAVSFQYDAAGNRISMSDGLGSASYGYDSLSRLTSENRNLNGVGAFPTSYSYNLANELMSVTDPFNFQVTYGRDNAGRLSSISHPGIQGLADTISSIQYRAFGKMKQATVSWNANTSTVSYTHDTRLEVSRFQIASSISGTQGVQYQRENDGRVSYAQDLSDPQFDRAYSYDQVGRVTQGLVGNEARGGSTPDGPYKQTFAYDAFDNLTNRTGRLWTHNVPAVNSSFVNNRNPNWQYDADGRVTSADNQQFRYDAAGRQVNATGSLFDMFDGDGIQLKYGIASFTYELPSCALGGQVLTKVTSQGARISTNVYAEQKRIGTDTEWEFSNPINSGVIAVSVGAAIGRAKEFSPMGENVQTENPYLEGGSGDGSGGYPAYGDPSTMRCGIDGMEINCNSLNKFYISKNWISVLTLTIRSQVGMRVPQTKAVLEPGGSHPGQSIYGGYGEGAQPSYVEIIAEPDVFEIRSIGSVMSWLDLRSIEYVSTQQKSAIVPLTAKGLEALIKDRLAYNNGDCANYVNKLISQAAKMAPADNPLNDFNGVMDLFDQIMRQPRGGFRLEPATGTTAGTGSGTVGGYLFRGDAKIIITPIGYYPDSPSYILRPVMENAPYRYGITGLHELIHQVGKYYYRDPLLTAAARALEPDQNLSDWDHALQNHCLPPNQRYSHKDF